jgi:phosphatidylglycerol:prolipoprotein diacylglycerol transferase
MPWGVEFTEAGNKVTGVPLGVHLHPTQLYESFGALLIFFFLLWLHRRKLFSGQVILFYAVLYAVMRFTIEIFRDDPRGDILGLTTLTGLSTSQMLSIIVGLWGLITLILRWRRVAGGAEKVSSTPDAARA